MKLGKRGYIEVDHDYRTSVPSIYAAGDVIGFPALAAHVKETQRQVRESFVRFVFF